MVHRQAQKSGKVVLCFGGPYCFVSTFCSWEWENVSLRRMQPLCINPDPTFVFPCGPWTNSGRPRLCWHPPEQGSFQVGSTPGRRWDRPGHHGQLVTPMDCFQAGMLWSTPCTGGRKAARDPPAAPPEGGLVFAIFATHEYERANSWLNDDPTLSQGLLGLVGDRSYCNLIRQPL